MSKYLLVIIACLMLQSAFCQVGKETFEDSFDQSYKENIRKDQINGRYIPKDLMDAHQTLDKIMEEGVKSVVRNLPDSLAARKTINAVGPYLMKNWNLYEGSRFGEYLKTNKGLYHPLDMAYYTLQTYHYYLNNESFSDEELLKYLTDRRKQIFRETVMDTTLDTLPAQHH